MHLALFNALDLRLRGAEIVVAGERADALTAAALALPYLDRVVLRAPAADALPPTHPAQAKVKAAGGVGVAFICVDQRCSLPVTEPQRIAEVARAMRA
jgi:uncharacterized protein YyaL (SSP411 family)